MGRFKFALPLMLVLFLAGCGMMYTVDSSIPKGTNPNSSSFSENPTYSSNTSPDDCYLCGGNIENLMPSKWGQNNIALISLNTFEIKPLEINRYDGNQLIEEFAGFGSVGGGPSENGGFSASLIVDHDRGYANGTVWFYDDEILDIGKMADFLCESCLNEILPLHPDRCFGVGAINLATKEICIFAEDLGGFTMGDFYVDCNLQAQDGDQHCMSILIFYCPIRYEKEP